MNKICLFTSDIIVAFIMSRQLPPHCPLGQGIIDMNRNGNFCTGT